VDAAIDGNVFPTLNGMHSEHFLLTGAREFVQIERFAASLFGIATRGAHLTCYVQTPQGLKVWVARRSSQLLTYPGLLDSTVAGGVKADNSPLDCILAEATEEASLPEDLVAKKVRSVGVLTLANRNLRTELHHSEVLYVYDMELAADVVPVPQDGEVEEFILMACPELRQRMLNGEFKPNVCPIMIDFLVRHGVITPESEKDYVDLCSRLRRRLPVPTMADE
jgi:8-oxo-dGTP pyrophosphatase MutT (NUDIX family)